MPVKKKVRYEQLHDGEWFAPKRKAFREQCCDCGLIHLWHFKLVTLANGSKQILAKAIRDNRATAQARKKQ